MSCKDVLVTYKNREKSMSRKGNYQPYKHWELEDFEKHFTKQIKEYEGSPEWVGIIAEEAIYSTEWQPLTYDGCTVVQDTYHPCLPCFIHDYLWRTGRGGKVSDQIFYDLMILDGTNKVKAWCMWFGVRMTWTFIFQWKYGKLKHNMGYGVFMYLESKRK